MFTFHTRCHYRQPSENSFQTHRIEQRHFSMLPHGTWKTGGHLQMQCLGNKMGSCHMSVCLWITQGCCWLPLPESRVTTTLTTPKFRSPEGCSRQARDNSMPHSEERLNRHCQAWHISRVDKATLIASGWVSLTSQAGNQHNWEFMKQSMNKP